MSVEQEDVVTFDDLNLDPPDEGTETGQETQGDAGVEETGEVEETAPVKATGKETGVVKDPAAAATDAQKAKLAQEVVRLLGDKAVARYRGKDVPLSEFTQDEALYFFNRGFGADLTFREAAEMRKAAQAEREALRRERETLLAGQQQVQRYLASQGKTEAAGRPGGTTNRLPEILRPREDDAEEVRVLKEAILEHQARLDEVEMGRAHAAYRAAESELLGQVDRLAEQYPLASKYEAVAVKALYPNADLEEVMRKGQEMYSSDAYIKNLIKHRPDFFRALREHWIAEYLGKQKEGPGRAPGRRFGAGAPPPAGVKEPEDETFDFDKAQDRTLKYLNERMKSVREEAS